MLLQLVLSLPPQAPAAAAANVVCELQEENDTELLGWIGHKHSFK